MKRWAWLVLSGCLAACGGAPAQRAGPIPTIPLANAPVENDAEPGDALPGERVVPVALDRCPAEEPSLDALAAAAREFDEAIRAHRNGDHDQALAHFRKAYSLACNDRVLFNIGVQFDKTGQIRQARAVFRDYLSREKSGIGMRRAEAYLECLNRREQNHSIDCLSEQTNITP